MTITVVDDLDDAFIDPADAWQTYELCFRGIDELAVQRHLMTRAEFDDVMHDKRIRKYLWLDDGRALRGIATYTNDLAAWPLISPAYFRRRWPDHYDARRIWYCGFVGVRGVGTGAFVELVDAMYEVAAADGGIIALDICAHNDRRGLPAAIERMLTDLAGTVAVSRIDTQTFFLYEFPTTIGSEVAA